MVFLQTLRKGLDFLQPEDVPALLDGGHAATVEKLRQRFLAGVVAQGEESTAALAEQQQALQQHWEEQRLAGLERHNAEMRARYAQKIAATGRG